MDSIFLDRYLIKWIGRCQYDTSDKVWGWFYHLDSANGKSAAAQKYCYVFWGPTGKTLSFNRKANSTFDLLALQRAKISRQYQPIDLDTFCSFWPNIEESWTNRFVFYLLSNSN